MWTISVQSLKQESSFSPLLPVFYRTLKNKYRHYVCFITIRSCFIPVVGGRPGVVVGSVGGSGPAAPGAAPPAETPPAAADPGDPAGGITGIVGEAKKAFWEEMYWNHLANELFRNAPRGHLDNLLVHSEVSTKFSMIRSDSGILFQIKEFSLMSHWSPLNLPFQNGCPNKGDSTVHWSKKPD